MSTMAPPVSLDGPLPVAPPHSLLSTPGVIVPNTVSPDRYLGGGVVWPFPPGMPEAVEPCATGTFRTKDEGEGWELEEFKSFTAYLPITCSSITAHADGFYDRVLLAFKAKESWRVARELALGSATDNPHLTDSNVTLLAGGAAVTADIAIAYLEEAIGATGIQGLIHMTPGAGAAANGSGGWQLDTVGGRLYTSANGTPVVLDGGYIGAQPTGGAAPGDGRSWAFATLPVAVRREDDVVQIGDDLKSSMDRGDNVVTFRAERGYLLTWDPDALQVAVLIDWTP